MPNRTPTDRQQKFIELLLADPAMNAVHAARDAGFAHPDVMGPRLRRNARVGAAIDAAIAARAARVEVKQDDVLRELLAVLKVDIGKAFGPDGKLLPLQPTKVKLDDGKEVTLEMPEDIRRAIAGIEVEELYAGRGEDRFAVGQVKRLKLLDKTRAIDLAMKHLGMFAATKHEHAVTFTDLVLATDRKAREAAKK